jgi:hypothetical protein
LEKKFAASLADRAGFEPTVVIRWPAHASIMEVSPDRNLRNAMIRQLT